MSILRPSFLAAAILLAASPAIAQNLGPRQSPVRPMGPPDIPADVDAGKVFACEGDRRMVARFVTQDTGLVAVVDIGNGPMTLPVRPFEGGEPKITWSDGPRTLVWTSGVRLMFTEGATHLMCGRSLPAAYH